ncbi:MAG: hypothetical protein H7Z13_13175 [Ferruginibacter sp.]|nr:hypothetical protein [Ferruginibacter sp.]
METKTDILNELVSLSPLIAGINKENVFTIPQGYFDSISTTVFATLQEEEAIFGLSGKSQMTDVPEGYFDQLANAILNKIKTGETATTETRDLSSVLYPIQNKNVFEVPHGYFENISKIIIDKITAAPAAEELMGISHILHSIQSKNVFKVPDGYFTHLPDNILKKVNKSTAKVVSMRTRRLFIQYTAAAMITGILCLGVYKYIDKPVSGVTIVNTVNTLDDSIEKGKNMNDKQFNETLENLTEADIAKYLEKNGEIADVAVLRNNLEENNLPSQEDYLLDETTLEKYLKEIEKTTLNN